MRKQRQQGQKSAPLGPVPIPQPRPQRMMRSNSENQELLRQRQVGTGAGGTAVAQQQDPRAGRSRAWQLGYDDGVTQAEGGLARIQGDAVTQRALQSASTTSGVSYDNLTAMAIIESTGDRRIGTNAFGYTGLMQMGRDAAADVGMSYSSLQGAQNVGNNALAGARYWNLNDERLDEGIPRDPLHMYLAHQQGAGGTNQLMETLGSTPNAAASRNQRNNLPGHVFEALGGRVTQQDFYDYWAGKMAAIQQAIQASRAPQS